MSDPQYSQPVILLDYGRPSRVQRGWRHLLAYGTLASWPATALAWVAMVGWEIKTVLYTGPALFALGAALALASVFTRAWWSLLLGAGLCAICCLFVILVNLMQWGPTRAEQPFAWMGAVYITLMAGPSMIAWQRRPRAVIA